jgi:hypothetical protein
VTITQLVDEPMARDQHAKALPSKANQTGNKNKKLNKVVLGNVKHYMFEEIMEIKNRKMSSTELKEIVNRCLAKEKITKENNCYKDYLINLILFSSNCDIFRKKYLIQRTPFFFKSKRN